MRIVPKSWNGILWAMRVTAPVMFCACVFFGGWAYQRGAMGSLVIQIFLASVNLGLTYVEWFVFKPNRGDRHGVVE